MKPDGPIFLVGCPRSGTTLLQRMLDAHSAVAIAPETHFIRRFWLKRNGFGDLTDDRDFRSLVDAVVAMPEFTDMGLDGDAFRGAAMASPREFATLFWLLLSTFAQIRNATVVGEKTPNHLLYMPTLQEFFPNARFIHIVRDPRAVVNSWRNVPWTTGWIAGDAMVWRRYMATARCHPPTDSSRIMTIRYEQLVQSPEGTLSTVCDFIGVSFEPQMCAFHHEAPTTVNVQREPWKQNVTRPIHAGPLDRWREELTPGALVRIEAVAGGEMRRLGYEPETPAWRRYAHGPPIWLCEFVRRVKKKITRMAK